MALVSGRETHVEPLIVKMLQRLLYHTAFPCGLFLSDIKTNKDNVDVFVEQVIGCGVLRKHKGKRLILPKFFFDDKSVFSMDVENIFKEKLKYKTAFRLPVSDTEQFVLLNVNEDDLSLPFDRILEPVLKNFGKSLALHRENEYHTLRLEEEIERRTVLEASLRESEVRHRKIFESTVDGIINIDINGIIESINPAGMKLFGYTSTELVGNNICMLMPEPFASQHDIFISKFSQTGSSVILGRNRELLARKKDGAVFPVDIALDEMIVNGKHMFTGIIRDVSELKEAEKNIINAKEDAEHASHAKSEFLSSMSHELRTPLNAILGFGQLIQLEESLPEQVKDNVDEIIVAGNHLLELINEILDLSKIESGHIDLSLESVDYNDLIGECVSLVKPIAGLNEIKISNSLSSNKILLYGDRTRLKQVIVNLLSNAIKYNRRGGQVNINVNHPNDNFYKISIKDTGLGIKEENLSQLFESFNRLDAKNTDVEGTGIGLVITKKLVELMGGRIGVESEYGQGSDFWIEVPKYTGSIVKAHSEVIKNISEDKIKDKDKYKILYIEDNPSNLKLVVQLIAMKSGMKLFTAHTANLGLELAEIKIPDLILLDINLPEMDGYKVLEKIRQNDKIKGIPVVGISANAMQNDFIKAEKAGFNDYLTKPLDIKKFYKTIEEILFKKE